MINEEYEDLVKNNDRSVYLKGSKRKKMDTKSNNRTDPEGPVMRDESEIERHD